ncbi:MOSC domain-containing protein [Cohnella cellulosilytica]|uniref:MOSC domain-containing protein n=1 Tax=Cohnella cellulosilytica TaxID=986710 RepID=A0ABW2F536_9BACL
MTSGHAAVAVYPLLSLNIGKVQTSIYKGKEAKSGIMKTSVQQTLRLTRLGFEGDEQADLENHGGPDKAICVYSFDHYRHWEEVLRRSLDYGAFGENFTVERIGEQEVRIGDIFRVGSAVVQVSQPRQPCWKLAMKWGLDELPLLVTNSGATGFYFRVLETGEVRAGDELSLLQPHFDGVTVTEANRVMHRDRDDAAGIRRLLAVDALSESWTTTLTKRLNRLESQSGGP